MCRIDGQWRQDRSDLREVVILHPLELFRRQILKFQKSNSIASQLRKKLFAPAAILFVDHLVDPGANCPKRFSRSHSVDAALANFRFNLLLDSCYADFEIDRKSVV